MAVLSAVLSIFTSEFFMTSFWRWIIVTVFGFITNYGWRIVLFTVLLKLLLYPLDFLNRKKSKDNARLMKKMKPEMDRVEKQYASNQQELMLKKRALQKRYGYGMGATCLTSLVTLAVFLTLWTGLTTISKEMNVAMFNNLATVYNTTYDNLENTENFGVVENANGDFKQAYIDNYIRAKLEDKANKNKPREEMVAEAEALLAAWKNPFVENPVYTADNIKKDGVLEVQFNEVRKYLSQQAVLVEYNENEKESFLWVKNIWRADTWVNPIPSVSEYQSMTGETLMDEGIYDNVMLAVKNENYKVWNGFLILVVLTVGLNFLNQFIAMRQQKASGETQVAGMGGTMKIMMIIMPLMLGFFALSYASAFTLYMVTNALMTLGGTGASNLILKYRDKKLDAMDAAGIPYGRAARDAKANPSKKINRGR